MISKWTENRPWTYLVGHPPRVDDDKPYAPTVKKITINGQIATKFALFAHIQGLSDKRYFMYNVTDFRDIELKDGDYIKILEINNINASYDRKTRQVYQSFSARVAVIPIEERQKIVPNDAKELENPYE